jgi:hypothetical protein
MPLLGRSGWMIKRLQWRTQVLRQHIDYLKVMAGIAGGWSPKSCTRCTWHSESHMYSLNTNMVIDLMKDLEMEASVFDTTSASRR